MCKVPALCIDHTEHEKDFHARACPLRGDMYEWNERSTGAGNRLAEDTLGQSKATKETQCVAGVQENMNTEFTAAGANPVSLCVNESNICAGQSASTSVATSLIF